MNKKQIEKFNEFKKPRYKLVDTKGNIIENFRTWDSAYTWKQKRGKDYDLKLEIKKIKNA